MYKKRSRVGSHPVPTQAWFLVVALGAIGGAIVSTTFGSLIAGLYAFGLFLGTVYSVPPLRSNPVPTPTSGDSPSFVARYPLSEPTPAANPRTDAPMHTCAHACTVPHTIPNQGWVVGPG